ncbi:deoxynucleotidyltransferase terminal-interacting protein 2-like [Oppia nitens]|uniref:deoxynucleotidyltransferase terminal-interacting protein 2-like n=1 Tax=Oppia nitens TaxID=1686743 RepID=UPI0023DAB827|nr:deoxynucleotidyltransferase terminal-interacting protein 2-like [Oppia nitens]
MANKKSVFGSGLDVQLKVLPYICNDQKPEDIMKTLNGMSLKTLETELSKKSVIKAGFEQNYTVEPFRVSRRMKKKMNRQESGKTLGKKWFDMKVADVTEEVKNDLLALKYRKGWNRDRFYKKNDNKALPKFFQMGTVIESKADFYHSRVPKKDRKKTLVEELLVDAEFKKYNKKRYSQALAENPYYLRMKRHKQKQQLKEKTEDKRHEKRQKFKKNNRKTTNN